MNDNTPLNCAQAEKLLSRRLDETLDIFQTQVLEDHLRKCPHCRAFAEDLRLIEKAASSGEGPTPMAEEDLERVVGAVIDRISEERKTGFAGIHARWRNTGSRKSGGNQGVTPRNAWPRFFRPLWGVPSLVSVAAAAVLILALLRSSPGPSPVRQPAPSSSPPSALDATSSKETEALLKTPRAEQRSAKERKGAAQSTGMSALRAQEPKAVGKQMSTGRDEEPATVGGEMPAEGESIELVLKAVGAPLPRTAAQRDSLITDLTRRLETSKTEKEREELKHALLALRKMRP